MSVKKAATKKAEKKQQSENAKQEEEKVLTPIEKCQVMHDKGMDEDAIIGALAQHDGMSIMKAVGFFKKFQKSAGLVLTKEDRVAKIENDVKAHVTTETEIQEDDKGNEVKVEVSRVNVKAACDALIAALDITAGAAKGHVRRYCKAHDVEMPTRQQLAADALEEFKDTVVASVKKGMAKASVVKSLIAVFKGEGDARELVSGFASVVDEKSAKRIYSRIVKAEGLSSARGNDNTAVIEFLKEKGADFVTKDGLANALVAELGISLPAAKRVWNYYTFVKQYNYVEEVEEVEEVETDVEITE